MHHPTPKLQTLFNRGAIEWNARRFLAAHEAWEELWRATDSAMRARAQGYTQIAAAWVKAERGNQRGTLSLMGKALKNLRQAGPLYHPHENEWLIATEAIYAALAAELPLSAVKAKRPFIVLAGSER